MTGLILWATRFKGGLDEFHTERMSKTTNFLKVVLVFIHSFKIIIRLPLGIRAGAGESENSRHFGSWRRWLEVSTRGQRQE